jgi:sensor histidine kinase regulating citrate/malate metabolism
MNENGTLAEDGLGVPVMGQTVLTNARTIESLYHGSGLWLVNLIVTHSDGRITFSGNEPRGSVVTLRFPEQ